MKSENHTDHDCDVTIIGGGVIGISSAYQLARTGRSVRLLEKGLIANGSSRENCGLISPSHALPLPRPGLIIKAVSMMLQNDAPLYVSPWMNWATMRWFMQTARKCNLSDMKHAMLGRLQLLDASRPMWNEMVNREGMEIELNEMGCIQVHAGKENMETFAPIQKMLDEIGLFATPLIGDELFQIEPGVRSDIYGGWFYKMDAHMRPESLMSEWTRIIAEMGVNIIEKCKVTDFKTTGTRIDSINTTKGNYSSENYVLATGAWSPFLSKKIGIKIPIQPGKGYSITLEKPEGSIKIPLILNEASMAVTPWKNRLRLGGTMEFSGYNSKINQRRIKALKRGARRYLKEPGEIPMKEEWYGWRPMTPDGMPIIDRSPNYSNLIIATGHNMQGMGMSPITGVLVKSLITGDEAPFDMSFYSAARF